MISHNNKQYHSTKEVCQILGLTLQSVLRYIKTGRLPAIKVGVQYYIGAEALERYLDAQLKPIPKKRGTNKINELKNILLYVKEAVEAKGIDWNSLTWALEDEKNKQEPARFQTDLENNPGPALDKAEETGRATFVNKSQRKLKPRRNKLKNKTLKL
jgi:excisionase family DNA binding protein